MNSHRFEKISKYMDDDSIILPTRATDGSAGYDFRAAEDTIIPSFHSIMKALDKIDSNSERCPWEEPYTMADVADLTKNLRPTLVPTGIKAYVEKSKFLQLSVRSSGPLKHWLILANAVGIIDSDYYNNNSNEGHIYFQIINLLPFDIKIPKGEKIGQGVFIPYETVENDIPDSMVREGGFGSTNG